MWTKDLLLVRFSRFGHPKASWHASDVRFCRIIFALYSLIRKYGAWLVIPAMRGGAAFLADSVLTPAVSISSAVEGLKTLPALEHLFTENKDLTMMITAVIIVILFG